MEQLSRPFSLEWGVAGRPLEGETESGDGYVVITDEGGAFIAVIDGLGHGVEAARASRLAAAALRDAPWVSLTEAITHCHQEIHGTRGAAITLASISAKAKSVTWTGVGNVDALLIHAAPGRAHDALLTRGGVVGYRIPPLRVRELPIVGEDTLIFTTDGIDSSFDRQPSLELSPQDLANEILLNHAKRYDDALVLVARYREATAP
jgi:negative regulator of sigma-B (phosphoserine phosphatase)